MSKTLFLLLILIAGNSFAQNGYIITTDRDTLSGKVTRGNLNSNWVSIESDIENKKIHLREIKEWKSGDMPVVVVPGKTGNREFWMELLLVSKGRKNLYRDYFHVRGNNIFFTVYDRKYVQLTKNNIELYLWKDMSTCKKFSDKYGPLNPKQVRRIHSTLEDVFHFYNTNCTED